MHKNYKTTWVFLLSILVLAPVTSLAGSVPSVTIGQATQIDQNSAHIDGSVRAGDSPDNEYWFEWSMVGNYDYAIFESQKSNISTWYGTSNTSHSVSTNLRGLAPNTQYRYRLVADNQAGKSSTDWKYFTTKVVDIQPESILVVNTLNARAIKEDSAIVRGYIAPHGSGANYWIEWGDTGDMKMRTPSRQIWGTGGEVEVPLSALTPGTVYFYRFVGENDRGVVHADQTLIFETHGTKPPRPGSQQSSAVDSQNKPEVDYTYEHSKDTHAVAARQTTGVNWLDSLLFGKQATTTKSTKDVDNKSVNDAIDRGETPANEETPDGTESPETTALDNASAVALAEKGVTVMVTKSGNSGKHETVEYSIGYRYDKTEVARDAKLVIVLPPSVVYIGDTTSNELLIQEGDKKSGTRTYVLPIGKLKKGDARTFSLIGMTTATANGTPDVPVVLAYKDAHGKGVTVMMTPKSGMLASLGSIFSSSNSSDSSASKWSALSMGSLPFVLMIIGFCIWVWSKAQKVLKSLKEKAVLAGGMSVSAGKASVSMVGGVVDRAQEIKNEIAARIKAKKNPESTVIEAPSEVAPNIVTENIASISDDSYADTFGLPGMQVLREEE